MWNDVGMIRCFSSEYGLDSSIEIEFHDAATYRNMHIKNYMKHTVAALSTKALALGCKPSDDNVGKIVVVALQGWSIYHLFNLCARNNPQNYSL